ncbi:DUF1516 family protein [Liquorilactobacillus satsumensis]|nr:DUF1516 family protein [Liquorilactobacillus satsumensis]
MIWLWLHLITWGILLGVTFGGLTGSATRAVRCIMIARVCYLVAIISGIFLLEFTWQRALFLTIIKVLAAFGLLGLIEVAFARKLRGTLSGTMRWLTFGMCVLVGIIGLILAHGHPFI